MKIYNELMSHSLCLSALLTFLITVNYVSVVVAASSQIIGSSVVTSVSVISGDEKKTTPTTPRPPRSTSPTTLTSTPPTFVTSKPDSKSGDQEVMSVIANLKSIVETERKKHTNSHTTNAVQATDESPPTPKSAKSDMDDEDEDDDGEDDEADDDEVVVVAPRDPPDSLKRKIKPSGSSDNTTATSVEVNAAIHKISGALLKPGKKPTKPIENILTDVLTSINGARNRTGVPTTIVPDRVVGSPQKFKTKTATRTPSATTTMKPKKSGSSSSTQKTSAPRPTTKPPATKAGSGTISKTKGPVTTIKPVGSSSSKVNMSAEPQIGSMVHHLKIQGIQVDENISPETETEEDLLDKGDVTTLKYTPKPPRPSKPARPQFMYSNTSGRNNASATNTRPADFYDDEIFGYDPYQTFLHGVYVPIVDLDGNVGIRDGPVVADTPTTTCKTEPETSHKRPPVIHPTARATPPPRQQPTTANLAAQQQSNSQSNQKPVASLPDHLYRPRPQHLQYQHTAVEATDTETGQVAVKVPHPGEKHANPDENFAPDRLPTQPRPILPTNVVKNLTDHHHAAHHGHGEHGGGHDHAHHGGDHHTGDHHGAHHGDHAGDHAHPHGHEHDHGHDHSGGHHHHHDRPEGIAEKRPTFERAPTGNPGLEATITDLDPEMRTFVDVNNKIALRLFSSLTNPVSKSASTYNNMVLSPFTIISSLGMLFLGARGATAAQFDGLLKLDDVLTFNPHMMYYNITQSFLSQPNTAAAVIRLLIADKEKGDVLDFFKTRVQHFYDTRVEEADYKFAGHLAQSIINQMIRAQIQRHSYEMLNYSLPLKGPMSLITASFFDGQFSGARDSTVKDMHFIHLAALGRRLIQVQAVSLRGPMRAAYDNELDATAVEVPYSTRDLSLILLMPGRPGEFAIGGVTSLKSRLTLETWTQLMRGFFPRDSFKIVFPRFRHQTALNLSYTMQRFGLTDMFQPHLAKFKGINGLNDLYLDQNMKHFTEFGTWEKLSDTLSEANLEGNKKFDLIRILRPQVREQYGTSAEPLTVSDWIFKSRSPPLSPRYSNYQSYQPFFSYSRVRSSRAGQRQPRSYKVNYYRQGDTGEPVVDDEKVLRFERPFLYILRHNPTGMILMTGQYSEPVTEE